MVDERTPSTGDAPAQPRRPGASTGVRTAAVWAAVEGRVRDRAAALGRPLRVVDLGGGTGGLAVPLAALGHLVTVVDPSPDALASLRRRAGEAGVTERVTALQGDAETLPALLAERGVPAPDLVCCHGTLEVVDDPAAAVAGLAEALPSGGLLSLLTAQRLAVVLARALAGRFEEAREALLSADGRFGPHDPLPRRFDADTLVALLADHGLRTLDVHGVRILSDLVPAGSVDTDADRTALLALEDAAARHAGGVLGQLGAAVHVVATKD